MNILFLSLNKFWSIEEKGIYTDLLREFIKNDHKVYILSPIERRDNVDMPQIIKENDSIIYKVYTGNIQKTNIIEKGINTLLIERRYIKAIKKMFSNVKFDLILYATPPITLYRAIKYVKNRDNSSSYLMLKDIFPQNAVDLGMLTKKGIRGILYKYFRYKEKKLYKISDRIGCMSQANVDYLLEHNKYLDASKVEVLPNSIEILDYQENIDRDSILSKYNIPTDRRIYIYGGNLGKPQDIPFVIECLKTQKNNPKSYFLIVGNGTEYKKLEAFVNNEKQANVKLIKRLPKEEYDELVSACDIGLIFLSHKFTIPNYPSRLLGYMQAGLPVFAITDKNTDLGKDIKNGGFGYWIESNDPSKFQQKVNIINNLELDIYKINSRKYLENNFDVAISMLTINKWKDGQ